jgi:hypothetical protein
VAVVAITTQDAKDVTRFGSAGAIPVVTDQLAGQPYTTSINTNALTVGPGPAAPAAALTAQLQRIPGVVGVAVVRADPNLTIPGTLVPNDGSIGGPGGPPAPIPAGIVSCAQLAAMPALGRCPAGATAAAFPAGGFLGALNSSGLFDVNTAAITWPAAHVPAAGLDSLGVDAINVATNGSVYAIERARTMLESAPAYPAVDAPSTLGDVIAQDHLANYAYQQLANTVILVSLPIAGCTLAASIAAGLADRKRPFSLLRLTGARLAMLRRVVALESAVPLLAVAVVALGTGFAAAGEYASVAQHHSLVAPGAGYYLLTAGGMVVCLGIIAATFPLLKRITGPEVARNE